MLAFREAHVAILAISGSLPSTRLSFSRAKKRPREVLETVARLICFQEERDERNHLSGEQTPHRRA